MDASPRRSRRVSFAGSPDAQAQAVEQAVEQGRRVAARGGDAVVVVDTLEYVPPHAARRALAAARNIADGGSLTVIATAPGAVRRRDARSSRSTRSSPRCGASRRSTCRAAARCAPDAAGRATRAPRRSPRRAPRQRLARLRRA